MATNRIWLTVGERKVLLAKGWYADGWVAWEPETLGQRIEEALQGESVDLPQVQVEDER